MSGTIAERPARRKFPFAHFLKRAERAGSPYHKPMHNGREARTTSMVFLPALAWPIIGGVLLLVALLMPGCAQSAEQRQVQPSRQNTQTENEQKTTSAGGTVVVNVFQHPDGISEYENTTSVPGAVKRTARAKGASSNGSGNSANDSEATYVMAGTTINVTLGDSTQTPTGSATGSGAQTPTLSGAQTPTLTPTATVTTPIAVGMPGSAPQASGAGSSGGPGSNVGPVSNTPSANPQIDYLQQKMRSGTATPDELIRLGQLLKAQADAQQQQPAGGTPVPAAQPAPANP